MKQKNLVLMAVAVGCGLVAAFLTSKLGAGSKANETIEVLVANKELKIGTTLDEKDFPEILTKMHVAPVNLPSDVIMNPEELKGKRLSRTLRKGNFFTPSDINANEGIPLPTGTFMYAVRTDAISASSGFVMPGDKVVVLALQKHPTNPNKVRSRLILNDMLVVAVDIHERRPEGGGSAFATVNSVSLAATPDQAKLLHNCEATGGQIRLLRRGPTTPDGADIKVDDWYSTRDLFDDDPNNGQGNGPETVQVAFARQEIPAGTRITAQNLGDLFELRPYLAPAPAKCIRDLSDLKGRWTHQALNVDLPVLDSALGDNEPAPAPPTIITKEIVKDRIIEKATPLPKGQGVEHQMTVITGNRVESHLFRGKDQKSLHLSANNDEQPTYEAPAPVPQPAKPEVKPAGPSI